MKRNSHDSQAHEAELKRFEENLRRYQQAVFTYLGRMGFSQAEAEDIAQEAFLRSWRSRDQYSSERGAWSTWLFRITRNAALNALELRRKSRVSCDTETILQASDGSRASDETEQRERNLAIKTAMAALSVEDRDVLSMAYVSGLSAEQAASVCGCQPGTYRTRLSRARERFLKQLEHTL